MYRLILAAFGFFNKILVRANQNFLGFSNSWETSWFLKRYSNKFYRTMNSLMFNAKLRVLDTIFSPYYRMKLNSKDISIISNDCLASGIYLKLGLKYTSPTIGLFFVSEDYIKFLENFEYYVQLAPEFKASSRFDEVNELRSTLNFYYPIGVLGNDIEIHFLHYKNKIEAADKWRRRTARINFTKLFFIFSDDEYFHEGFLDSSGGKYFRDEFLNRYLKLKFEHKIFFSSKQRENNPCIVFLKNNSQVRGNVRDRKYEKYIDVIKWLNGEQNYIKTHCK
jgi:uncharacterized protein (DUF1919 family)